MKKLSRIFLSWKASYLQLYSVIFTTQQNLLQKWIANVHPRMPLLGKLTSCASWRLLSLQQERIKSAREPLSLWNFPNNFSFINITTHWKNLSLISSIIHLNGFLCENLVLLDDRSTQFILVIFLLLFKCLFSAHHLCL